jgi:hypothetical protein
VILQTPITMRFYSPLATEKECLGAQVILLGVNALLGSPGNKLEVVEVAVVLGLAPFTC